MPSTPPQQPPTPQGDGDQKKKFLIAAGALIGTAAAVLLYKLVTRPSDDRRGRPQRRQPSDDKPSRPSIQGSSIPSSKGIETPVTPATADIRTAFAKHGTPVAQDEWKVYTNEELGFSLQYPSGFHEPQVVENGLGAGYIVAVGRDERNPLFLLSVEHVSQTVSVKMILEQQTAMMTQMGVTASQASTRNINGIDAHVVKLKGQGQMPLDMDLVMFQKQNRIFSTRLEHSIPEEDKRIVEKILQSITVSDISTVGTLSFHSVRHNLDIDLPDLEFVVKDTRGSEPTIVRAIFENPATNSVISGVQVTSKPKRDYSSTLDLFAEMRKKKLEKRSDFSEGSLEGLTVCGKETRVFEYVDTLDGNKHHFMEVLFATEEDTFIVTFFSLVDKFSEFRNAALDSLKSIKIDEDAPTKRERDTVTYRNPKYKFSIEMEKGLNVVESTTATPVVTGTYSREEDKEEDSRFFSTMVMVEDNNIGSDIETQREQIKRFIQQQSQMSQMMGQAGASTVTSDEIVKIDGRDAVAISYDSVDLSGQITNIVHLIPVGDKVFTVKTQLREEDLQDVGISRMIDRIHKSFNTWY